MPKVSRGFETEADYLGVEYLYKAGYDPQAYISFFERVQVLEDHNLGFITKFFASHPPTANRIQKTQREIARILPNRDVYVLTTSEFEDVKLRLAIYEGRRPTNDEDMDPLTLRRKDTESASDNDQPPTLKR
jgi:predicted Zn-dependent protease